MVDYAEIPLELQLREAHRRIQNHVGKGRKYPQFLSPMFLRRFPAIMDNQISVHWDTITGAYDQAPLFPIMLIDTEVLDYWCAHPTVWEVVCNLQHSRLGAGNSMLHPTWRQQGQTSRHVRGITSLHPGPSVTNQPQRCPVLLEACQGRLCSLSFDARQADIFSSTSREPVLYFITHQRRLRHGLWSTKFVRSGYSSGGQS